MWSSSQAIPVIPDGSTTNALPARDRDRQDRFGGGPGRGNIQDSYTVERNRRGIEGRGGNELVPGRWAHKGQVRIGKEPG